MKRLILWGNDHLMIRNKYALVIAFLLGLGGLATLSAIRSNTAHDEERDKAISTQAAYNAEFRTFQLEIGAYTNCLDRIEFREVLQVALLAQNDTDLRQNDTLRDILRKFRDISEREDAEEFYTPLFDRLNAQDLVIVSLRETIINDYKAPPLETCGSRPEAPIVEEGVEPVQETLD